MSQQRDDEWLWDICIHYIDMSAKLLEGYIKTNYSVTDLDQKMAFSVVGIWDPKVFLGSMVSPTPDFSPGITLFVPVALCPAARQ